MTYEGFIEFLSRKAEEHGSWRNLAAALGYSPQYLSDLKAGKRKPGDDFLAALGMEAVTDYRKKKVLP